MRRVVVRECSDRGEAEVVRGLLESRGIPAEVEADDCGGQRPSLAFAAGVRVWVDEADLAPAHEALAAGAGDRIVLRTFPTRGEAEFTCEMLRADGIAAAVLSDDCRAVDPALTFANGAHVLVPAAEAERAEELLAAPLQGEEVEDEGAGEEAP